MAFDPSVFEGLGQEFTGSTPIKGIESAIFRLSEDVADEFREYMRKNGIGATLELQNTIGGVPLNISDNGFEIRIEALDYFKFVDEGVDGVEVGHGSQFKFKSLKPFSIPGLESLRTWGSTKGLPVVADLDSLVYAMSVSIKKKGIMPKNITEGVLNEGLLDRMNESIIAALGEAIGLTLQKNFEAWQ